MRIHRSVLLREAVELLRCRPSGVYVDCTVGMAGHAEAILAASSPDGFLLGIDRDEEAIGFAAERLAAYAQRFRLVHGDYRMINQILTEQEITSPNAILADLGVSMMQFTEPSRGFSFQTEAELDMRMDRSQDLTAADIVNSEEEAELARILREFGEEKAARRIAKRIVEIRAENPIRTTTELRQIVESVVPVRREKRIHPATLTFQALRIAVNRELEGLDQFLFDAFDALVNGGRLVVIAFHSLEDRIVKRCFQFLSAACRCSKALMVCVCGGKPLSNNLTSRPMTAGEEEVRANPPSRSAKMRAIEKYEGPAPRHLWNQWLAERA